LLKKKHRLKYLKNKFKNKSRSPLRNNKPKNKNTVKKSNNWWNKDKNNRPNKKLMKKNNSNQLSSKIRINWVTWERRRKEKPVHLIRSLHQEVSLTRNNSKCYRVWFKQSVKILHLWENPSNLLMTMLKLWTSSFNFGEDNTTHQRVKCKMRWRFLKSHCCQFMIRLLKFKNKLKIKKPKYKMLKHKL
jgi:hypothetical protein